MNTLSDEEEEEMVQNSTLYSRMCIEFWFIFVVCFALLRFLLYMWTSSASY